MQIDHYNNGLKKTKLARWVEIIDSWCIVRMTKLVLLLIIGIEIIVILTEITNLYLK